MPRQHLAALPHGGQIELSTGVAAIAAGVSILTALAFSVLPVLRASRGDLADGLRGTRTTTNARPGVRRVLVAVEIAVALVLLAGTGLLARSVQQLMNVSPGFETTGLLTMRVAMPGTRYDTAAAVNATTERLVGRLSAIPGVEGVAHIDQAPLTGRGNNGAVLFDPPRGNGEAPTVLLRTVSANYFDVMGIPLLGGRRFTPRDDEGAPRVVLVNRTLAERLYPGENPVGRRIWFEFVPDHPRWQIAGIVGDEQFDELDRDRWPVVHRAGGVPRPDVARRPDRSGPDAPAGIGMSLRARQVARARVESTQVEVSAATSSAARRSCRMFSGGACGGTEQAVLRM